LKTILLCFAMWGITGGLALAQSVQGTWELVSYDYGGGKKPMDPKRRQVKLITADHYIWTEYDIATGELKSSSGGSYKYENPAWLEHVDFADKGEVWLAGKDQQLKIVVQGDKMELSGQMASGTKITESWKRVH
jgi:hypothetical protein